MYFTFWVTYYHILLLEEVGYIFCDSITNVQVSLLDLVPKLAKKLKQHAFHGHHKHPDASLQVITDIYPLSFLTTLLTKMASHSLNSSKEQLQASRIMFQDLYIADESSVAHTLASAFH